jgi:hypothetical protein
MLFGKEDAHIFLQIVNDSYGLGYPQRCEVAGRNTRHGSDPEANKTLPEEETKQRIK